MANEASVAQALPDYEFENPAQAWVSLVEACHLEHQEARKIAAQKFIFLAKNSHWTQQLYDEELNMMDVEWGLADGEGKEQQEDHQEDSSTQEYIEGDAEASVGA